MMLRHNLRTDVQNCGKSATQASLFVRHGRGVNRVYSIPLLLINTDQIDHQSNFLTNVSQSP